MIAIIDYGMGNIKSLGNALDSIGAPWRLTADPAEISAAPRVILPGVGNAAEAMANICRLGLDSVIKDLRQPVLGICVGMQVMCRHSDEGDADCLGILDARGERFQASPGLKVPHMGWSRIGNLESRLFSGISSGDYMNIDHSYFAPLGQDTIATCTHGRMFSAALKYENFYGVQFHPEKSSAVGLRLLKNFSEL